MLNGVCVNAERACHLTETVLKQRHIKNLESHGLHPSIYDLIRWQ